MYSLVNLGGEGLPLAPNPLFRTAFSGYRRAARAVFPPPLLIIMVGSIVTFI